jgi:uncharacterized membrane protein (UPF0127 family)
MRREERVLLPCVLIAERWHERMRGLLGRQGLAPGTGMLLSPCGSVHTAGMRFVIDVVYLDNGGRVVRIVRGLQPWRMSFGGLRARSALEMQSGWFDFSGLEPGTPVSFAE